MANWKTSMSTWDPEAKAVCRGKVIEVGGNDYSSKTGFSGRKRNFRSSRPSRIQRGQATLELLIALLILIPLIFGAFELSRGIAVRAALDSGVGVGVRALSLDPSAAQLNWVRTIVDNAVQENVFGSGGLGAVSVYTVPADISGLAFGATFCLIGAVEFTPDMPLLSNTTITIRVRHYGVIEKID
jgi:hypothetical protein